MIGQLLEAWRIARADRQFPEVAPVAALVVRMQDSPDETHREVPLVVHDKIALTALEVAIDEIGKGETANNCGPDVARYCGCEGVNWCAGFVGHCYEVAAERLGIPLPFKRSLGAKKLGKNVGAVGRVFTDPTEGQPGDLVIWHRGAQGSWAGHVGILQRVHEGNAITVIEGNSGPIVRRTRHDLARERLAFFASLRGKP